MATDPFTLFEIAALQFSLIGAMMFVLVLCGIALSGMVMLAAEKIGKWWRDIHEPELDVFDDQFDPTGP